MAYAYWKSGKVEDTAVFDLFFRKNPFSGEFTIFAGLEECIKFLYNFRYSDSDIAYLKQILPPYIEEEFFRYLKDLTVEDVTLFAIPEGSVVFPRYFTIMVHISFVGSKYIFILQSSLVEGRRATYCSPAVRNNISEFDQLL
jgi:nicotinate phosphoribosyltransferase